MVAHGVISANFMLHVPDDIYFDTERLLNDRRLVTIPLPYMPLRKDFKGICMSTNFVEVVLITHS
jgi:hypothetical protein